MSDPHVDRTPPDDESSNASPNASSNASPNASPEGERPRRLRTWTLRLGLMIFSPLLLLLLIELVWQLIGDPRIAANEEFLATRLPHFRLAKLGMLRVDPDPTISFTLKPGFDTTLDGKRYRINRHGFRGPDVEKAKPNANTKRVLVLGDSYGFGFGVDENETIAAQLQAKLSEDHAGIEVLNMGVPGYQTGQQRSALRRDGLAFEPDLVILVYYANDNVESAFLYDPRIGACYVDELPLPYDAKRFMIRSILYSKITKAYTNHLEGSGVLDAHGPRNWPVTSRRLKRIDELCRRAGARFLIAALPGLDTSFDFIDARHPFNRDHDRVIEFASSSNLPVVDLRAVLLAWAFRHNEGLPPPALESPASLLQWVRGKRGISADYLPPPELMAEFATLQLTPSPIEELFVGPTKEMRDSHLTGRGYELVATAIADRIRQLALLR